MCHQRSCHRYVLVHVCNISMILYYLVLCKSYAMSGSLLLFVVGDNTNCGVIIVVALSWRTVCTWRRMCAHPSHCGDDYRPVNLSAALAASHVGRTQRSSKFIMNITTLVTIYYTVPSTGGVARALFALDLVEAPSAATALAAAAAALAASTTAVDDGILTATSE